MVFCDLLFQLRKYRRLCISRRVTLVVSDIHDIWSFKGQLIHVDSFGPRLCGRFLGLRERFGTNASAGDLQIAWCTSISFRRRLCKYRCLLAHGQEECLYRGRVVSEHRILVVKYQSSVGDLATDSLQFCHLQGCLRLVALLGIKVHVFPLL